jgi:hypothetical protein
LYITLIKFFCGHLVRTSIRYNCSNCQQRATCISKMKYFNYSKRDIRSLSLFYKMCTVLAVIPPYNFEKCTVSRSMWKKIQGFLLIITISTITAYSIYLRQHFHVNVFTLTSVVLDYLDEFFVVTVALNAIFKSCFCNQENWLKLNNDFQYIDHILKNRDVKEPNVVASTSVQLFLYLTLYFVGVVCLLYVWTQELGILMLKSYTMHQYCYMYNVLLHFLIYKLASGLKCRYEDLNKLLELKNIDEKRATIFLRKIGNISQRLAKIVDLVNKIFGTTLIYITGYSIVKILTCLNFLIYEFKSDGGSHHKSSILVSSLCTAAFTLVIFLFVKTACMLFFSCRCLLAWS